MTAGGPAAAKGAELGGAGAHYVFKESWSSPATRVLTYGRAADRVYVGD